MPFPASAQALASAHSGLPSFTPDDLLFSQNGPAQDILMVLSLDLSPLKVSSALLFAPTHFTHISVVKLLML